MLLLLLLGFILHVTTRGGCIAVIRVVAHRIRCLIMRLSVILMLRLLMLLVVVAWGLLRTALKVDVHPSLILFGAVLQIQFAADLFNARLDLLDMILAVVALTHDHVKMCLAMALRVADSLLKDLFCFFDILAVKVDSVAGDFADGIVLAEDVLGGLLVVLIRFGSVLLPLLA